MIMAIALGIWGALLVLGLASGLTNMHHKNAVSTYVSHIQIHHPRYDKFALLEDVVQNQDAITSALAKDSRIQGFSPRIKVESFLQSTNGNGALILNGIYPEKEAGVTTIHQTLQEGNYLKDYKRKPPIIISYKLAERLKLGIGSSLKLSFNNIEGAAVSSAFKVVDMFKSGNTLYDEVTAFVPYETLEQLSLSDAPHEIAVMLNEEEQVEAMAAELRKQFPESSIQTWRSIAPELGYADKMLDLVMTLFLSIIMAALAFGIVNTMLMAVLERKKELGMLLAVGMNKKRLFKMIMLETLILCFSGAPLGMLMAILTQLVLGKTGIDLSFLAKGLESVGLQSTIYPSMELKTLLILTVLVVITGLLSALYPSRKALALNPSETLRSAV